MDFTHPYLTLMLQMLQRAGIDLSKAIAAITTICQTALGFQQGYQGKVQRYLRHHGQQMLDAVSQDFTFSHIGSEDAQSAFTHWLQNVLNVPVPLSEPVVARFCEKRGVLLEELLQVADELDLNVALLDDMIANYADSDQSESEAGREEPAN